MRAIKLIDMTLRESSAIRDNSLSFKEKLEIARILDRLKADRIELPLMSGSKADLLSNKTIASAVKCPLTAPVAIASGNIEETWDSIRYAHAPQLNVMAPVSTVQMEYVCHKKAPAMLALIEETVKKCRFYTEAVELTALDATRADREFLYQAIETAIGAGASAVTISDSAGIMLPDEFGAFITDIKENVASLAGVKLYAEPSDAMYMGAACAAFAGTYMWSGDTIGTVLFFR